MICRFDWYLSYITGSVVVRPDYQMGGSSPGPKPQWCSHCRVVILGNGVRKSTKDLPINKQVFNTHVIETPKTLIYRICILMSPRCLESLDLISPPKGCEMICSTSWCGSRLHPLTQHWRRLKQRAIKHLKMCNPLKVPQGGTE